MVYFAPRIYRFTTAALLRTGGGSRHRNKHVRESAHPGGGAEQKQRVPRGQLTRGRAEWLQRPPHPLRGAPELSPFLPIPRPSRFSRPPVSSNKPPFFKWLENKSWFQSLATERNLSHDDHSETQGPAMARHSLQAAGSRSRVQTEPKSGSSACTCCMKPQRFQALTSPLQRVQSKGEGLAGILASVQCLEAAGVRSRDCPAVGKAPPFPPPGQGDISVPLFRAGKSQLCQVKSSGCRFAQRGENRAEHGRPLLPPHRLSALTPSIPSGLSRSVCYYWLGTQDALTRIHILTQK